MTKNNKGITMITLIVTIILMLIIAGVTINQSVKNIEARKIDSLYADLELLEDKVNTYYLNNGSLPIKEEFKGSDNFKSVRNVNDNNVYYVIDISKLEGVSLSMKLDFTGDDVYIMNEQSHTVYFPKGLTIDGETYYMLPKQYSKIMTSEPSVDENGLADKDTTIKAKDDPDIQIVIPKGFAPVILMTDRTDSMPGENGAVKSIMPKEQWNSITAEQINKGIVVVDYAITYTGSVPDFNEYVWIPISDSSKFARVAWNGPYWNGFNWQEGEHPLANSSETSKYWEKTSSEEYTDMVDGVSINKGFYISRYEASEMNSTTAQSKRGQNPWTKVARTTAKTASSNMKSEMNSHLIYGVEWDSILQWLLDSQAKIGADTVGEPLQTIAIEDIQSDSRSWGNYNNSVGGAAENSGSRQPSGINEYWKVNNIYDLAGNVLEWTQENYSTGAVRAVRGGDYYSDGAGVPAANRNSYGEGVTDNGIRFQGRLLCVALYSGSDN